MVTGNEYVRISQIGEKISAGTATSNEKDEYMLLMYTVGSINRAQYENYIAKKNSSEADQLVKTALIIGALALLVHLFSKK